MDIMKWLRSKEEKRLKKLCDVLKAELRTADDKQAEVQTDLGVALAEIGSLKELSIKRVGHMASLKEDLKELKESHKKLLDKSIEHTEALIYLQCAKAMDHIKNGGSIKDMDDEAKVLEISRSTRDALCVQRQALMGDPQRQQAGSALGHAFGPGLEQFLGPTFAR